MKTVGLLAGLFLLVFPARTQQVSQQVPIVADAGAETASAVQSRSSESETAKDVSALEEQMEALQRSNSAGRTALWADDLVYIGSDSRVHDKPSLARAVSAGEVKIESLEVSDRKIRVYGDLAIVTATEKRKASFDGKEPQDQTLQYTRVWARRGGAWQVVSFQETRVAQRVAQGSSSESELGMFAEENIIRVIGGFNSQKGRRYVLDVNFRTDMNSLARTNPHLVIEVSPDFYEENFLIGGVVLAICATLVSIGVILCLVAAFRERQKRKRQGHLNNSVSMSRTL